MARILSACFGLVAYAMFLLAFLYAVGFVEGMIVPKDINTGDIEPTISAVVIDILLLSLFALQHSLMARRPFKQWWTRFVPAVIERSSYVLLASACTRSLPI
jgi:protein-S-isoprenylcysteine O-methyltransferase Ste14